MTHGTEQCRFERPRLKKLFKNRPKCEITLGNEMDLDHFLGTFFDKIINFFDVVVIWYFDPSGDFALLPCTVYLVFLIIFELAGYYGGRWGQNGKNEKLTL